MNDKLKAFLIAGLILFGLFIFGFLATNAVMAVVVGSGNEVEVPDIVGLTFDAARKKCMDVNLYVQQVEERHDDKIAVNRVISQSPEPLKRTKINKTVEVVVSKGRELVRVPYLDNITEREARIRLDNIGLLLGNVAYRYSTQVDKDLVISSEPIADSFVPKGSRVNVIVSLGHLPDATQRRDRYRDLLDGVNE